MLEFVTVAGARCASPDGKVGTLTAGKEADIVLLAADPLNRRRAMRSCAAPTSVSTCLGEISGKPTGLSAASAGTFFWTFLDDPCGAAAAPMKPGHLLCTNLAGRRRMPAGGSPRPCIAIARISRRFLS